MLKKISVVLCAGLFATAFAAGCKKDKKDGEAASGGATCGSVAARAVGDMSKGKEAMFTADVKTKMTAAIVKVCTDDKWSSELLQCGATAKDPKTDCKFTPEQQTHMGEVMAG